MRLISKTDVKQRLFSTCAGRRAGVLFESLTNPFFKTVEIETISTCNRKCVYCPNHSYERPAGLMEEAVFFKLIDELADIGFSGTLSPHFYGEPLLDKRLERFIADARARLPKVYIELFTNGDYLTGDRFGKLVEAGVDMFRVTLHDGKQPEHITDLLAALEGKDDKNRLCLINFEDGETLYNRGGLVEVDNRANMIFCNLRTVTINYEGNVVLCCQDYFSRHRFGNIKAESVVDIWNKREFKVLRDRIKCGDWPLEICEKCAG